jgi:hypothetical protein
MVDPPLAKLRAKRRRICAQLRKLEPLLAGYHAKLAEVEAAILALDPQLWLPPRTYKTNGVFARGEFPRLALAIMREEGVPLPVAVITRRMLAAKGIDLPDRRTFKLTKNRLHNALLALDARGVTMKVGRGNATRRGLLPP